MIPHLGMTKNQTLTLTTKIDIKLDLLKIKSFAPSPFQMAKIAATPCNISRHPTLVLFTMVSR